MAPRRLQIGFRWPKMAPDCPKIAQERLQIAEDGLQSAEDEADRSRTHLRSSSFSTVFQVLPFPLCSPRYVEQPLALLPGLLPSRFGGEIGGGLLQKMWFSHRTFVIFGVLTILRGHDRGLASAKAPKIDSRASRRANVVKC